ncbi:MAG: hypothetical protein GF390_01165 [Candidatus Pacebacteria bacterium]|nr:hypothetical protein [Candidatus Paceibacterota bacterium]
MTVKQKQERIKNMIGNSAKEKTGSSPELTKEIETFIKKEIARYEKRLSSPEYQEKERALDRLILKTRIKILRKILAREPIDWKTEKETFKEEYIQLYDLVKKLTEQAGSLLLADNQEEFWSLYGSDDWSGSVKQVITQNLSKLGFTI